MIAKLKGIIDSIDLNTLILDVNGVGYHIFSSAKTLREAGAAGEATTLLIETHVREDHIHLYGFASVQERDWFRLLCTVQGVGTKVALAMLSSASPSELQLAIAAQDKAMITRAEGVGPKLATRILTELKDKVSKMQLDSVTLSGGKTIQGIDQGPGVVETDTGFPILYKDAVSALVNLGYDRALAFEATRKTVSDLGEAAELEAVITQSLKELSA